MHLTVPGLDVAHSEVQAGEVRLHVAEAGAGEPLLLVHGWPQHWWTWRKLMPALSERYRVIVPDLRGFGWSEAPKGAYAKQTFAADTLALMDAMSIEKARLVGHDWGGYAVQLAALDAPERVEKVAALSIIHPWLKLERPTPKQVARTSYQFVLASPVVGAQVTRRTGLIKTVLAKGAGPDHRWADGEREAFADRFKDSDRAGATSALYRTFLTEELKQLGKETRELAMPALYLTGDQDPVVSPERQAGAKGVDVTQHVIPGAGHFLTEESPDAVLAELKAFLV